MKKLFLSLVMLIWIGGMMLPWFSLAQEESTNYSNNFEDGISQSIWSIRDKLDNPVVQTKKSWTAWKIVERIISVFFSVMVVVWVLVAMIGLYQVLFSWDESKIKTWTSTLIYGIIGIILMYSAKYLTDIVFTTLFHSWSWKAITVKAMISNLYNQVMLRVFTYITSSDEGTKKKSLGVIIRTTIGMLIISWAKQMVEAVYGKQDEVINGTTSTNLWEIGTNFLNPKDVPIIYNVINRALGLVSFVLLAIILYQTYKMLIKPDDAATFSSLKKTILYALGGLLLIWSAYLLSNLFIIGW